MPKKKIYTIGHSTRSLTEFTGLLRSFGIAKLVDIRHYPGSKRYPHFNRGQLQVTLAAIGIEYVHLVDLGGRRKPRKDSQNTAWRVEAFRGYADYMETEGFRRAAIELEHHGLGAPTAYMCSEAVWWSCHRALVSDYLKARGWTVLHILQENKAGEHPYTAPARIENGRLVYKTTDLFTG